VPTWMVGVRGINVNQVKFPAELREDCDVVAHRNQPRNWSRVELCAALLNRSTASIEVWWKTRERGGNPAPVEEKFFVGGAAGKVSILADVTATWAGVTEGLDERGFLRIRNAEGLRTVVSGT